METKHIRVSCRDRVAHITLDRPPLNVLDIPMLHELSRAIHEVTSGGNDFVVFRGAGEKGFCAGVEVRDHTPARIRDMLSSFHGIFRQLWRADCVTIAAVHGYCLGGGMELATFCDFVVSAESAEFGQPEIRLGAFPPVAMVMLPALVGPRAATDLILTGRAISAGEAREMGLVSRLVPDGEFQMGIDAMLGELRSLSPVVLRMTRRALWQSAGMQFEKALHEVEELYVQELVKTEDNAEGIRAFLEKRAPVWKGL